MISYSQYLFGSSLLPVVCKGFLCLPCHRPLWSPLCSSVKPVLATVCHSFDPLLIHTSFLSSPKPSHNMGMFNFSSCLGVHPLSPALFTGLLLSSLEVSLCQLSLSLSPPGCCLLHSTGAVYQAPRKRLTDTQLAYHAWKWKLITSCVAPVGYNLVT